jgi:hypothetical protein
MQLAQGTTASICGVYYPAGTNGYGNSVEEATTDGEESVNYHWDSHHVLYTTPPHPKTGHSLGFPRTFLYETGESS